MVLAVWNKSMRRAVLRGLSAGASRATLGSLSAFFREANELIRNGRVEELVEAVQRFAPLASEEGGEEAAAFWKEVRAAARSATERRMKRGRPQSVWGVTPIVNVRHCAEADRQLGLGSDTLVFEVYHVTSNFDINLGPAQNRILDGYGELFYPFRRYVLAWALLSYDIFHLYNDRGLLEPAGGYGSDRFGIAIAEMDAYKATGKALFTYAYGADHRMRKRTQSLAPLNFCMDCPEPGKFCLCDDDGGQRMLATISSYATRMVGFGLSLDLLPNAHFMNYLVVEPAEFVPAVSDTENRTVLKVGHFPNHGFFKGTAYLEDAVARLNAEGVAIEMVHLSGLPRRQILEAMRGVDVVVDQLISGAFGLTAVEAMALGRPVIAHLRPGVAIAAPEACPVIPATPDTIAQVLRDIAADRTPLQRASAQGVDYVYRYCSVDALALSLDELYSLYLDLPDLTRASIAFWRRAIQRRREDREIAVHNKKVSRFRHLVRPFTRGWESVARSAHRLRVPLRLLLLIDAGLKLVRNFLGTVMRSVRLLARYTTLLPRRLLARYTTLLPRRLVGGVIRRLAGTADRHSDRWLERRIEPARIASEQRLQAGVVRTLWGVTPILTLPLKARADRALGFQSRSVVFNTYVITRSFDINLEMPWLFVAKFIPHFLPVFHKLVFGLLLTRYDVFHYFFDRGLLPTPKRFGIDLGELDMLRRAGKRVYVYAYGADVRMRQRTLELGRWNFCVDCPQPGLFCICDDVVASRTIADITKRSTAVIALGDMIAYVPGCRRMHYWPIDSARIAPLASVSNKSVLRIAHAPNHTHFKGSVYLEKAIETLRQEGHKIEYVKIQGRPNDQVMMLFGSADVVADQFIGGAYGYTALEAMARGKPVLTYVRTPDLVEAVDDCPLINTDPVHLLDTLRWLLSNRDRLPAIGAQGRAYVEKWHSVEAVAARFGAMYAETADFPPPVLKRIESFQAREKVRRAAIANVPGWEHPFRVGTDGAAA